jgi:SAM-dependent methyltransferase
MISRAPSSIVKTPDAAQHSDYAVKLRQQRERRRAHFDQLAGERDRFRKRNRYYHDSVTKLVRFLIPEGKSVLEVGSSTGDLLAGLKPSRGLGIDLSPAMVDVATAKHPHLEFRTADAEDVDLGGETFDFIVLSDVLGLVNDVWQVFRNLQQACHPRTRLVITGHNALWEPALDLAETLGLKMPNDPTSWLGLNDLENLLHLNHYEVVSSGTSTLMPKKIPLVSELINRTVANLPGVRHLNLIQYMVARPLWDEAGPPKPKPLTCSIVIPTMNEAGNVVDIFERTPYLGPETELVFVDGRSTDGTIEEIERLLPTREAKLVFQTGKGNGDAVRAAYDACTKDIYFILDSDLTVPPEDLPKFYLAIAEGKGEFINGTRLVYPMEDEAMRFLNKIGNKFFSVALSAVLGQQLKDTLCGTKVLTAEDYAEIEAGRHYFGEFDPFGDFDLIFGAAKRQLKIVEVPIRYQARTYGEIKIDRWRHGVLLLRMTGLALWKFTLARRDA